MPGRPCPPASGELTRDTVAVEERMLFLFFFPFLGMFTIPEIILEPAYLLGCGSSPLCVEILIL